MAQRNFRSLKGSLSQGIVILTGTFVTSTNGTIASSDCDGFSIAKTATKTGRYTVTLQDKYMKLRGLVANIVGTTDAAYTTAKGVKTIIRNRAVATAKTFDIQFQVGDGVTDVYADAEIENAAEVLLTIVLKDSGAQ